MNGSWRNLETSQSTLAKSYRRRIKWSSFSCRCNAFIQVKFMNWQEQPSNTSKISRKKFGFDSSTWCIMLSRRISWAGRIWLLNWMSQCTVDQSFIKERTTNNDGCLVCIENWIRFHKNHKKVTEISTNEITELKLFEIRFRHFAILYFIKNIIETTQHARRIQVGIPRQRSRRSQRSLKKKLI